MIGNRNATPGGSGETLHLHATDSDDEWLATIGAEAVDMALMR